MVYKLQIQYTICVQRSRFNNEQGTAGQLIYGQIGGYVLATYMML